MTLLGVLAVAALIALVGAGIVLAARSASPRDDEVLPEHYAAALQYDRTNYPGHCPTCGSDNEPGYTFCRNCGSEVPSADHTPSETDVRWIVDR